jgi:hypothetical protein
MRTGQITMSKLIDIIFFCSVIIFNISVSVVYLATKFESTVLLQVAGAVIISLIIPFTATLLGYMKEKIEKKIIISHVIILFYLFLELLLDYILVIPFREIPAIHVLYIMVFYVAEFSMIAVTFDRNRKMGFVVMITFLVLIGCLIYLYAG